MAITILGITESSRAVIGIFLFHLGSMLLLFVLGGIAIACRGTEMLWDNLSGRIARERLGGNEPQ